eukprot:TRINITY_DN1926_c0_g1_i1.p1 TRINITY_DN1926_c0_g1~~TRINITY_DN1926_c0_g1_i1.p1  ORF type:complete len:150 (-),score=34.55 TRINITY_DN1926_c0_g1_i1:94-543(-)
MYLSGQQKAEIDEEALKNVKKQIFHDGAKNGWLLLSYSDQNPNKIVLEAHGTGGASEFRPLLKDNQIQYLLVRIPDEKDGNPTIRDIAIYWTGPAVKALERGRKKFHFDFVGHHLAPVHCSLQVLNSTHLNDETVRLKSNPGSGSHVLE